MLDENFANKPMARFGSERADAKSTGLAGDRRGEVFAPYILLNRCRYVSSKHGSGYN